MPRHLRVQHVTDAAARALWTRNPPSPFPSIRHRHLSNSAHQQPQQSVRQTVEAVRKKRSPLAWAIFASLATGLGLYSALLVSAAMTPCTNPGVADLAQQKDVSRRYDETADSFDSEVGLSEFLMGINGERKKLARQCKGDVLEVSCGTGRNLGYFDISTAGPIDSLTFIDLSPQMVEVCKRKFNALFGSTLAADIRSGSKSFKQGLIVRFLSVSALETMPLAPKEKKYDTIIQTMGLCSTPSPKQLLLNMVQHLDLTNPEAKILLLEHGRSYRSWMNHIIDSSAEKHAEIHGCWPNRDIGELVDEAAKQTGLQVVKQKRRHFGTTWIFELRPHPELVRRNKVHIAEKKAAEKEFPEAGATPARTWRQWLGLG